MVPSSAGPAYPPFRLLLLFVLIHNLPPEPADALDMPDGFPTYESTEERNEREDRRAFRDQLRKHGPGSYLAIERKAGEPLRYLNLSLEEQRELNACFGGDDSPHEPHPVIQEDGYGVITPFANKIRGYRALAPHLHDAPRVLVIGYGAGVMPAYFWAEMRGKHKAKGRMHLVEPRASKEAIATRNFEKRGTYMTGDYAERQCRPLPIPKENYVFHTFDAFEDISLSTNEVGQKGSPHDSVIAANGPYGAIYVGCAVNLETNMLDLLLKLLDPDIGGIVFPLHWEPLQGLIHFAPNGNCQLLEFTDTKMCETEYVHNIHEKHLPREYWISMLKACYFLDRHYQEKIYDTTLAEIRNRHAACDECGRPEDEDHKNLDTKLVAMPKNPYEAGWKTYFRKMEADYEEELREREEQIKWDEGEKERTIREEEEKRKAFKFPDIDPNIPDETWFRQWINDSWRLPRINKKGVGIDESWSPPSGYESEDRCDDKQLAPTGAPIHIEPWQPGESLYDYYVPPPKVHDEAYNCTNEESESEEGFQRRKWEKVVRRMKKHPKGIGASAGRRSEV